MKRTVFSALALFGAMLVGASANAQPQNRVGVAIYKYDDHFMSVMRKDLENETKNINHINWLMNDSQNSQVKQLKQIETLLAHHANVLAVNIVNANESQTIVEKARAQNVPIIFFNRTPSPQALASYEKAYFVSEDPAESGKIQGELIAKHWKANPAFDLNHDGKLQFALLKGEPSEVSESRSNAVVEALHRQGIETEAVFSDTAMWRSAVARNKMNEWLVSPQANRIEVVISNNDEMAFGALDALRAHEKKLPLFGVDALPEAQALIKTGEMMGSVLNDSLAQSKAIVKIATNLVDGKPALQGTVWENQSSHTLYVPQKAVDRDSLPMVR